MGKRYTDGAVRSSSMLARLFLIVLLLILTSVLGLAQQDASGGQPIGRAANSAADNPRDIKAQGNSSLSEQHENSTGKLKSLTGVISDTTCGTHHRMLPGSSNAECTRYCYAKQAKYALVVGDKVYTLETTDKSALATLDRQAGAKVSVTGTEKDNTITVNSVTAAP